MNKLQLGRILTVFGLATLLASLVDILSVLIPLHLSDPNWVYLTSQDLAERSIIPLLGIILTLTGLYLNNNQSRVSLNFQRILSVLSFLFGLGLILITVFYTLTLSSIENQVSQSIKQKGESLKKQIAISYMQQQGIKETTGKIAIPGEMRKYFTEVDKKVNSEIKSTKMSLLKKNIKTILNLILFAIAYLYTAIATFKVSSIALKQLLIKKEKE